MSRSPLTAATVSVPASGRAGGLCAQGDRHVRRVRVEDVVVRVQDGDRDRRERRALGPARRLLDEGEMIGRPRTGAAVTAMVPVVTLLSESSVALIV